MYAALIPCRLPWMTMLVVRFGVQRPSPRCSPGCDLRARRAETCPTISSLKQRPSVLDVPSLL